MRRTFKIGEVRVGVRATSAAVGQWLDEHVRHLAVPREPDDIDVLSIVVGEDDGTGPRRLHTLYSGAQAVARTFHAPTLGAMVIAALESHRYHLRDDAVYVQAAIMQTGDGHVVLIPATLIPHLARQGARLRRAGISMPAQLSTAVDQTRGVVTPIPHQLGIAPEAADHLAELIPSGPDRAGFLVRADHRVDAVFTVSWDGGDDVRRLSRGEALSELASAVMNRGQVGDAGLGGLARLIEGADCFAIEADRPHRMLDAMLASLPGATPTV